MAKDYYNILGVGKDASSDDIKKAYRKLAHQHHPDKEGGDEAKFKEINEAYQVLSSAEKRKTYDQFGEAGVNGQGFGGGMNWEDVVRQSGFNGGFQGADFDLGDIFSEFFGGGGGRKRGSQHRRGQDIQMDVTIEFHEAAFGIKKTIELYKSVKCHRCSGNGAEPGTPIKECATCKGRGSIEQMQRSMLGAIRTQTVCPTCEGEGKKADTNCTACAGTGMERKNVEIEIAIPAGIDAGQTIRVSGQGEAGSRGAAQGDLYVNIHIRSHEGWTRKEEHIYSMKEAPYTTMVLGGKITVPTLDGDVVLKIPPATESGKLMRLKGKGVPRLHGSGRGDHFVRVDVAVPKHVSLRMKRLLKNIADLE